MDRKNFEQIERYFFAKNEEIRKISINFALLNTLSDHPYITENMARRIVKGRQQKGVLVDKKQLTERDILTPKEARRIAHYLDYHTDSLGSQSTTRP